MINPYANTIGITGIIGSGKSSVADVLEKKGAFVIRADVLAAEALNPSYRNYNILKQKLCELLEFHGVGNRVDEIIVKGEINRKKLGEIVFGNAELIRGLNDIVHPEVKEIFAREVARVKKKNTIIVYDVPLLFETGLQQFLKKSVLVYAPEDVSIERAAIRLGISTDQVKKRLSYQISIEQKKDMADYVLDNSGNRKQLDTEVEKLWRYLQELK